MADRKVPEAVLEAFREAHGFHLVPADKGGAIEGALVIALDAYDELLRGGEAEEAGAQMFHKVLMSNDEVSDYTASAWIIQAAIDSARGENSG